MSLAALQLGTPAHRQYVTRLYRKALRLSADWYWQRRECREKQVIIRAMFDANKAETNPRIVAGQLRETEKALAYYFHPIPYVSPTAPGGSKWERNVPFPEELCARGVTVFDNN
ncbi:hypothetical protein SmJEL517_g03729 [Synchytrium microbalum]|uniref:NADH dehydrogenase [ubiquinone] 1 beta subcomplex subunit 9 n=1 Tax=Synchytrium microbalum TaxID=1806994 RepID=A0A507C5J0_9FUNG|nr:uncharacterized protein SmJEL517_g03729 [Synchytrium microbalum]TPX33364.1 hypothetical protein SmJEL517_g03729 [Synchytrium microbalum]